MKKIFLITFLFFSLAPNLVGARGLVPCGGCAVDYAADGSCPTPEPSCQLCHLFTLLDNIVDFVLFRIILPLATLLLVFGGILFIFSAENPENVKKGRAILTSVVIGLIIIFAAWLIINAFFTLMGVAEWTGLREGWFRIPCPIEAP